MKRFAFLFFSLTLFSSSLYAQDTPCNLTIHIQGVEKENGQILIAVYADEETFDKGENFIDSATVVPKKGNLVYDFKGLKPGSYAIAILHDENDNADMDLSFIGIPKEGYGFSGDKTSKMKKPNFDDAVIQIQKDQEITIKMYYW